MKQLRRGNGAYSICRLYGDRARDCRSVQTTVGWIFRDPGVVARYEQHGVPAVLGHVGARSAPFAGAGPDAVIVALGSISDHGIRLLFQLLDANDGFMDLWRD